MYFNSAHILVGIIFIITSSCSAQKQCDSGSQCKELKNCPQMVKLAESGISANIQIVLKSICQFVGGKTMVCCPATLTGSTGHPGQTERLVNLLPSKCGHPAADDKIIKGTPSPLGAYPWMAALGYTALGNSKPNFRCAGTIINSKYVLTAAHCLHPTLSVIHLGDYNLATDRDCETTPLGLRCSNPHIAAGVEETITHPMYDKRAKSSDDIALIRLDTTLDFDNAAATIQPVCIPPNGFNFKTFAGSRAPVATGWGLTEHGNNSDILLRVNVPIADDALCKKIYKGNFVGNQLCIGGSEGRFDTCSGDSGGPLVMTGQHGPPFYQVGIVSFGPSPCGVIGTPGVYINVADYRDWIIKNMRP